MSTLMTTSATSVPPPVFVVREWKKGQLIGISYINSEEALASKIADMKEHPNYGETYSFDIHQSVGWSTTQAA